VISSRALIGFEGFLKAHGVPLASVARASGVQPGAIRDLDAMLPVKGVAALFELASQKCGDKAFGLHFGEVSEIRDGSLLYYVTAHAATLRDSLLAWVRYSRLVVTGYRLRFEEHSGQGRWLWELPDALGPRAQFVDFLVAAQIRRIGALLGHDFVPVRVALCHAALVAKSEYHRALGRRVAFDCERAELTIDRKSLAQPLPESDPNLAAILETMSKSVLERLQRQQDVVWRTSEALVGLLRKGKPELIEVSRVLDVPPRSLQRQLKQAGTTFQALVDETRKRTAEHLLHDTKSPMTEIAYMLGYSELSAFSRAFKGWFGSSPRALRRHRRAT
jgi:AraC-like DNA-binding protein